MCKFLSAAYEVDSSPGKVITQISLYGLFEVDRWPTAPLWLNSIVCLIFDTLQLLDKVKDGASKVCHGPVHGKLESKFKEICSRRHDLANTIGLTKLILDIVIKFLDVNSIKFKSSKEKNTCIGKWVCFFERLLHSVELSKIDLKEYIRVRDAVRDQIKQLNRPKLRKLSGYICNFYDTSLSKTSDWSSDYRDFDLIFTFWSALKSNEKLSYTFPSMTMQEQDTIFDMCNVTESVLGISNDALFCAPRFFKI